MYDTLPTVLLELLAQWFKDEEPLQSIIALAFRWKAYPNQNYIKIRNFEFICHESKYIYNYMKNKIYLDLIVCVLD